MSGDAIAAAKDDRPRLRAPTPRVAVAIAGAVLVAVLLYLGRDALTPFIIGALLVYVLDPLVRLVSRLRVRRWHIPRGLAVLLVYVAVFVAVVQGLSWLLGPLVGQLVDFIGDVPALVAAVDGALAELGRSYQALDLPPQMREFIDQAIADAVEGADFDPAALLPIAQTILGTVAGFLGFLIVPIWAFYLLRDRVRLTGGLDRRIPADWRADTWAVLRIIERIFGRWLRAQLLLGVIIGVATYFGLLLLGWFVDPRFLQFALLLAVIAGVLELLPIIGPILAMIPTLLLALTTNDPLVALIAVVALYFIVQQFENAVLVPKIQGDAVELHPSLIIFVLILGAAIAGLMGAILSVPLTAVGIGIYTYAFRRASGSSPAEATPRGLAPTDADEPALTDPPAEHGGQGQPDDEEEAGVADRPTPEVHVPADGRGRQIEP
ncbi:MAG TPA: AI-2E family transporter [Candidatus Limnocylindrales bacterium]|nr:AI-2E family transporter [Candidatus Limnocylindrales bacterium]